MRITLVWTDPPGNPAASLKLVNNLDLVVTNLDSGKVFFGNDIPSGSDFTQPWDTNTPPNLDVVNNVENVYLAPATAANYSVTVVARQVNVNAVTGRTNTVVQDYALVISSGDGGVTNALSVTDSPVGSGSSANVTFITNSFASDQGISGALLLNERVGAQGSLPDTNSITWPGGPNGVITVGLTNQWQFYVLTNDQGYNHAAFLTFQSVNLSLPRLGVNQTNLDNATRAEADVDLYVSTDPGLTNLDPVVLAEAHTVLGRGGTGAVVYNNVAPGAVYYVGVKAEDQEAAQYAFMGVFSLLPFGEKDESGTWILRGINLPALIPDGTTVRPGVTNVVAIAPEPIPVRRVVVTNELWHDSFPDLLGTLSHGRKSAVLNNRSLPPVAPAPYQYTYVYEDNDEGDIPAAQDTDSPGSLLNFVGEEGLGVWLLTLEDNAPGNTGRVQNLTIRLDPQNLGSLVSRDVLTNASYFDFVDVPIGATNLTVWLYNDSTTILPVELYLRRGDLPTQTNFNQMLVVTSPSGYLSVNLDSFPPLNAGRYYLGVFNTNEIPQAIRLDAMVDLDPGGSVPVTYTSAGPAPILDDAVSVSTIHVTNTSPILSLDVGVRIDHPRVSDLVLTLVSPSGTRVLLDENRGGATPGGLGLNVILTNTFVTNSSYGPAASTNIIHTPSTSGNLTISYNFWSEPDTLRVYCGTNLIPASRIFDSGEVTNVGIFLVAFSTNDSRLITIVIDEDRPPTAWNYTAILTCPALLYTTFSENTNLTVTPMKFAQPPFTEVTLSPITLAPSAGIYYLPEQSLDKLAGETAFGDWTLEILDNRAGATDPEPSLVSWQLSFVFQNPIPTPIITLLASGVPVSGTNSGAGDSTDYFQYVVTTNAVRAQFEIDHPTGDVTLVARRGLPPPTLTSYDCLSANPGANEELITLFNFSAPVALTPGDWFVSVVNVSGGPVGYTIKATEFPAYATNVIITSCETLTNNLCLTWTSVSGIHYYVQGETNVAGTNWVAVSPTLVAADVLTSCCIPLPSPYHFFRVSEGLAVTSYVPPVQITSIARDTSGVRLQWLAPTNSQFQPQWTASLAPPDWTPFTNILTSTDGTFNFLDDGSQSGGLAGSRYYRLKHLP